MADAEVAFAGKPSFIDFSFGLGCRSKDTQCIRKSHRSTVADIVRRLVERGLLQRERTKHDARMYAVSITSQGQAALDQADPTRQMCEDRLLEAVPAKDRESFIRALQSIIETFGPISSAQVKPRRDVPNDGPTTPSQ